MARKTPRALVMEIDHRPVPFPEGATVLRAAELNGFAIPSLCSHKDLSPFGGCRLCMVEIEGMRGYPLACSTTAREGMKVLTDTSVLRELRREILALILSEHPSSCLFCDERDACRTFQTTIRKTGVSTGCRFCPNDHQCELQQVVEKVGLSDIDYPVHYHGYEPEHDDPFYDRDYNICILCGRCVRMCQEVRGTGILAFIHRGPRVRIGPAFGRSHIEAGCEFCGACVDVCPTGALTDKASKWDGIPDGVLASTCPFCAIGCRIGLVHKDGRLSRVRAEMDPEINEGQLCVKGRFCLPEATHHFERARKPALREGPYFREVPWERAIETVASRLTGLGPGEFRMLVSPDLTNESLFAARKFVRTCVPGGDLDSSARQTLGGGRALWARLFSLPISIRNIARADAILAVGLDSRFAFSVVGTRVRQALAAGARLVTIDPLDSNLARYTEDWLRPRPGREGLLLRVAADRLAGWVVDVPAAAAAAGVDPGDLARALDVLSSGRDLTVIVGPRVFGYHDREDLAAGLSALADRRRVNFVPLYCGANSRGALEIGVLPEPPPGPGRPKVLYLVGEAPFFERPDCDFLVVQDLYLPAFPVDAFLPAASFAEAGGTLVNIEGRVQRVAPVEHPPEGAVAGRMRPDWRILADLARALGRPGFDWASAEDVYREIRAVVAGFPAKVDRRPRRFKGNGHPVAVSPAGSPPADDRFVLVVEPGGYGHRGFDLSSKVGGLRELGLEEGFRMSPDDLAALGLRPGDQIRITGDLIPEAVPGPVRADPECPAGVVFLSRPAALGGLGHRTALAPAFRLARNPCRIDVHPADAVPGGKHEG